jgi:hypothetical protein
LISADLSQFPESSRYFRDWNVICTDDVAELSSEFRGGAHVQQCDLFAAFQPALKACGAGIALTFEQANQPWQESDSRNQAKAT